jgi:catechol 2,3-dioxygenase-like lactoylglutathione lyase family enzyme
MTLAAGITMFVSDLEASRDFYERALGMLVESDDDGFWAYLDGITLRVEGGARPRRRGRHFFEEAGVLVRLETDDFDGFVGQLVGRGVQLFGQVKNTDEGRFTGFVDPDGNLFELVELTGA